MAPAGGCFWRDFVVQDGLVSTGRILDRLAPSQRYLIPLIHASIGPETLLSAVSIENTMDM